MTLSVLTLNLWNNSGPYPARQRLLREWIERLDPDLVGFQEALRGGDWDQVAELCEGLEYDLAYARASEFWLDPTLEVGNAIASRWPIADREALELPHGDDAERRVALSVTVNAPVGAVGFTVTHLQWKLHHGAVRERQVVALCDLALRRRPADGFPPILAGDFNAEPDSTEIRYVQGLHSLDGRSVHFRDAWRVAGDGGPGFTWSTRHPYARASNEPNRRIDYVFCGYPTWGGRGRVERCRVVCDEERDGVWPTDHLGVLAELRTEPVPDEGS